MWLVTGGAGYIGAHVVQAMQQTGYPVVVVDDLSTGTAHRLPSDVPLVVLDIRDSSALTQVLVDYGVTGVIHLAAKKDPHASIAQAVFYHEQNTCGVVSVVAALSRAGVHNLVYSSSAAVYGEPVDDLPIAESAVPQPGHPYGRSKLIGEWVIRDAAGPAQLSWVALRYFNVAGCGAPHLADTTATNLIPLLLRAYCLSEPARIYGDDYPTADGTGVRDYIHVVDLAAAHVAAARAVSARPMQQVINIGTGQGSSVRQVIAAASAALGTELPVEVTGRRAGDPGQVRAEVLLAEQELGWKSTLGLTDMVTSSVQALPWLQEHGYLPRRPAAAD